MAMSELWFVLAGFLLGFAASTLWEWLHFRRSRMKLRDQRVVELEAELHEQERQLDEVRTLAMSTAGWANPNYHNPGVFLDSETADETTFVSARPVTEPAPMAGLKQPPAPQPIVPEQVPVEREPVPAAAVAVASAQEDIAPQPPKVEPEPEISRPVRAPEPIVVRPKPMPRSTDSPDDLSKVKGIGDVYKYRLYHAGIFTWWEVARSDPQTLRAATHAYPSSNVEEWPEQARVLAEKYGRMHAVYTGPVPDDLTRIKGIGPVGAQVLYRAGICTYEQLLDVSVDELKELFPVAVAGDQPDFADWIRQAVEHATRKLQA